jgi:hypothetical protein
MALARHLVGVVGLGDDGPGQVQAPEVVLGEVGLLFELLPHAVGSLGRPPKRASVNAERPAAGRAHESPREQATGPSQT